MSSPIPGPVAAPLIAFVALVTIGRWILLRRTATDRLLNRALAWAGAGLLLLERGLAPQFGSLMHQVSMGCMVMGVMSAYGAAALWAGADPATARARQRRYDLVGVAGAVTILLVGAESRREGRLLGQLPDWESAASALALCLPAVACGRLMWRALWREARRADATRRERLVYGTLLAALTAGAAGLPFSAALLIGRRTVDDPELLRWAVPNFVVITVAAAVLAVPLADVLATRAGLDRSRRRCRRLLPLWRDVTGAVPEIVLDSDSAPHRGDADVRLIRMTVEIRDALLHLNRYVPDDLPDTEDDPPRRYATRIAYAIRTKRAGTGPVRTNPGAAPLGPECADIDAELRHLLALAKVWPVVVETDARPAPRTAPAGWSGRFATRA